MYRLNTARVFALFVLNIYVPSTIHFKKFSTSSGFFATVCRNTTTLVYGYSTPSLSKLTNSRKPALRAMNRWGSTSQPRRPRPVPTPGDRDKVRRLVATSRRGREQIQTYCTARNVPSHPGTPQACLWPRFYLSGLQHF